MIFIILLERVLRIFHDSLYEPRGRIICYSYKEESGHEPIISTYMYSRRVWIKWSYRDWTTGCVEEPFRVKKYVKPTKINLFKAMETVEYQKRTPSISLHHFYNLWAYK